MENDFVTSFPHKLRATSWLISASLMLYVLWYQAGEFLYYAYKSSLLLGIFVSFAVVLLFLFAVAIWGFGLLTVLFDTEHLWNPDVRLKLAVEIYIEEHNTGDWFSPTQVRSIDTMVFALTREHRITELEWEKNREDFIKKLISDTEVHNLQVFIEQDGPDRLIRFKWQAIKSTKS
jgi:hypothetical protein